MKVGDLVKLHDDAHHVSRPGEHWDRVGIITEWESVSGWVQWAGNSDWDIEYQEDLEVLSESR
jgi:hypothetical protein